MKTIISTLLALSVLSGVAASASAVDYQQFWRDHPTSGQG